MSARPGRIREIVPVGLGPGSGRGEALRQDVEYFRVVTAVREALHADTATGPVTRVGELR
jgi:NitT/TauT family transport system ATP-binding protein